MLPPKAKRWVIDVFGPGSQIAWARRLRLGGWHVNHAMDVIDARGHVHRVVLRRWARSGWQADDPDYTVQREGRVLELLQSTAIPVPAVIAADPAGERCDVPALLLARLAGHPPTHADFASDGFSRQLATTLAAIHDLGARARSQSDPYRLYYDRSNATLARWIPATATWSRAIATVRQPPPSTAMTLIHRDYHPENTLWSHGRLTGIARATRLSRAARPQQLEMNLRGLANLKRPIRLNPALRRNPHAAQPPKRAQQLEISATASTYRHSVNVKPRQ